MSVILMLPLNHYIMEELFKKYPDFIFHLTKCSWGFCINIMEKTGSGYCKFYMFHDDNLNSYMEGLHVNKEYRKTGLGNIFLTIGFDISNMLSVNYLNIKADITKWMYYWYKRKGFEKDKDAINDGKDNLVWMFKKFN